MATEILPSSFRCDCGHESDFFENTISEIESMSKRRTQRLSDGEEMNHTIIFHNGKATEIQCHKLGKCKIAESE